VRRSAAAALRALGPGAAPLLREAAGGTGIGEEARRLLEETARSLGRAAPRDGPPGEAPPGAPADPARKPPLRGRAALDRVRTELGLDPERTRVVGGRLLEFGRALRETMEDARDGLVSYEDARAKGDALRARLREDLTGTLTEEQIGKLDGILDSMGPGKRKAPPQAPKGREPQ
jgi:hypothetical protein